MKNNITQVMQNLNVLVEESINHIEATNPELFEKIGAVYRHNASSLHADVELVPTARIKLYINNNDEHFEIGTIDINTLTAH